MTSDSRETSIGRKNPRYSLRPASQASGKDLAPRTNYDNLMIAKAATTIPRRRNSGSHNDNSSVYLYFRISLCLSLHCRA